MKTKLLLWPAAALLGLSSLSAQATPTVDLYEFDINIDGVSSYIKPGGEAVPAGVDLSLFDMSTGLGTISATFSGAGSHNFTAFFDHDIGSYTFDNEIGSTSGVAASGQSWEIDDPAGDIFDNFDVNTLENSIGVSGLSDISMAMGWDFLLGGNQTATINLLLSDERPDSGFFLKQRNMVGGNPNYLRSNYDLYLSSTISVVPEPSILLLMGIGLVGMVANRRKETA
ncbi:MAG: PEP-CTERM sorting domain-containing protein [Gammaproteobacteria bacterium]|nr:PEP-CTERM sorting domain-containing protein [Gammaproteobacteria bacterium]